MAAARAYVPLPGTQKYVLPNRCTTNPQVRSLLRGSLGAGSSADCGCTGWAVLSSHVTAWSC